jgi:hypothetical protein
MQNFKLRLNSGTLESLDPVFLNYEISVAPLAKMSMIKTKQAQKGIPNRTWG